MRVIKCPLCNLDMRSFMVQNVEIDKCPKCEGIWLDRGELEQLAEKDRTAIIEAIKSQNLAYENLLDILCKI